MRPVAAALGNGQDGVAIANANNNSLIGCTFFQNPFAFYNVIAGNGGNGVSVTSANNVTVQANFLGIGADNCDDRFPTTATASWLPELRRIRRLAVSFRWEMSSRATPLMGSWFATRPAVSSPSTPLLESQHSRPLLLRTGWTGSSSPRRAATTRSEPVLSPAIMAMALRLAAMPRVYRSQKPPLEPTPRSFQQFQTREAVS